MHMLSALFLSVAFLVQQCRAAASYNAAVFEFTPKMALTQQTRAQATQIMQANLANYDQWLLKAQNTVAASGETLDIAVFPEDGLYGPLMYNRSFIAPYAERMPAAGTKVCGNVAWSGSVALTKAACLARQHAVYLVVDMAEAVGGSVVYNTQVAFNRQGELVAKYHKSHLYFEPQFNVSSPPKPVFFDTDFGVRFALMICFDVMFKEPQTTLKSYMGPPHFIYSSWWVNKSPLINALQTQASWAALFRKTLLASGSGYNSRSSGSGIYQNDTVLASYYNPTRTSSNHMLIANVQNDQQWHCKKKRDAPLPLPLPVMGAARRHMFAANAPLRPFRVNSTLLYRGASGNLVTFDGSTDCTVQYVNAAPQVGAEMYGVLALDGNYNGLLNVSVCAFVRCLSPTCRAFTIAKPAAFQSVQLTGGFRRSPLSPLTFATGDAGQLEKIQTTKKGNQVIVNVQSRKLLGVTIWGLHF